jgi:hypothetical protein
MFSLGKKQQRIYIQRREGMNYQEEREARRNAFEDVLQFCERTVGLMRSIENSRKGTKIFNNIINLQSVKQDEFIQRNGGVVIVSDGQHPGGKVFYGEEGWEEWLCRRSTLYPCLLTQELEECCYNGSSENDESVVYIPNVTFFKSNDEVMLPEPEWYQADVFIMYRKH